MPNLVLHIGLHKTGTTAIQTFFRNNRRQIFQKTGFDYVPVGVAAGHGHANLAWQIRNDQRFSTCRGTWDDVFRYIQSQNVNSRFYIISSEEFDGFDFDDIKKLGKILESCNVTIVLMLRNQFDLAVAMHKQNMKRFMMPDLANWLEKVKQGYRFNFDELVRNWEMLGSNHAINILPYERVSENLIGNFACQAGIPQEILSYLPKYNLLKNTSLSYSFFNAYQALIKEYDDAGKRENFLLKRKKILQNAEKNGYNKFDGIPVSDYDACAFMKSFYEGNKFIHDCFVKLPKEYFNPPQPAPFENQEITSEEIEQLSRP